MSDVFPDAPAFFDSYRAAFERFDAAAVADHFAVPVHVDSRGAGGVTVIGSRKDWLAQVERLLAMYRAIDVAAARILEMRMTESTRDAARAAVLWALDDSTGRPLYEFSAEYALIAVDGRARIRSITHDEVPRYRECVARLRAGDSEGR